MNREVLSPEALKKALEGLPAWQVTAEGTLRRDAECPTFPEAIELVVEVGEVAEEMNHHPDIDIRWRTVYFSLVTHDAGGLTELDTTMAAAIDVMAATY